MYKEAILNIPGDYCIEDVSIVSNVFRFLFFPSFDYCFVFHLSQICFQLYLFVLHQLV